MPWQMKRLVVVARMWAASARVGLMSRHRRVRVFNVQRSTLALTFSNTTTGYTEQYIYKVLTHIHNNETNQIHLLGIFEKGPPIVCNRSH